MFFHHLVDCGLEFSAVGLAVVVHMALGGPVSDSLGVSFWFLLVGALMSLMGAGAFFVQPILCVDDAKFEVVVPRGEVGLFEEGESISGML